MPPRKKGGKGGKPQKAASAIADDKPVNSSHRSCTGVLSSREQARDIQIHNFSLTLHGMELVKDSTIELNYGRRYGLIGFNGSGKSTLLNCLGHREVPIPEHIDIYLLEAEVQASETTALQSVINEIETIREKLEKEAEELVLQNPEDDGLQLIYERLDELEVNTAESRAAKILHGLGFSKEMQHKATKEFSGGWRMRIALAKALFLRPMLLLLDEPTNHLDLEACVWLEEYLKNYNHILLLVSHSQDFMNTVCTNIIHLHQKAMTYYGGNYDTYLAVRAEKEEHQMKRYDTEQAKIAHYKDFIARFGHGSKKLARQAKSREKSMARMKEQGLTDRVQGDKVQSFSFPDCEDIPPPVLQFINVDFAYQPKPNAKPQYLFRNLDLGIDLDSRVALVGPNGAGKSTLLKLMVGDLCATNGIAKRHQKLRIGWFHQHLHEKLDSNISPLQYLMKEFSESGLGDEGFRRQLGRYGVTGTNQTTKIGILSDGLKSRVVFSWLAFKQPQLLLLDEPTNHLDMETIDALADAINEFSGGVVLVSHDFRLIDQVAEEIWEVRDCKVTKWTQDIVKYKESLRQHILQDL